MVDDLKDVLKSGLFERAQLMVGFCYTIFQRQTVLLVGCWFFMVKTV